MGKIISLVNQKGGVGKTTSSINLAASLGVLRQKVLLIDLDPQGNASTGLGINKADFEKSVYDMLIDEATISEVTIKTKFKNLSIIPATINLAGADIELMEKSKLEPGFIKGNQLKKYLDTVKDDYDYIIIDCPPSLGILTTNALTASDSVIIPVQCEFFALEGLSQLMNTIRLVKKKLNDSIVIDGVVLTMRESRSNLGRQVADEIRKFFATTVFETQIPRNVRLAEAPSYGEPICLYDKACGGAKAYLKLTQEYFDRNNVSYNK